MHRYFQNLKSPKRHVELNRVSGVFPTISSDGSKLAFVDNEFKSVWLADSEGVRMVFDVIYTYIAYIFVIIYLCHICMMMGFYVIFFYRQKAQTASSQQFGTKIQRRIHSMCAWDLLSTLTNHWKSMLSLMCPMCLVIILGLYLSQEGHSIMPSHLPIHKVTSFGSL